MESIIPEAQKQSKQPDGSFTMKMGTTTYQIGVFFNKATKENLDDKIKRLMRKEVMAESSKL